MENQEQMKELKDYLNHMDKRIIESFFDLWYSNKYNVNYLNMFNKFKKMTNYIFESKKNKLNKIIKGFDNLTLEEINDIMTFFLNENISLRNNINCDIKIENICYNLSYKYVNDINNINENHIRDSYYGIFINNPHYLEYRNHINKLYMEILSYVYDRFNKLRTEKQIIIYFND